MPDYIKCPFTILFDDRERSGGWTFMNLKADARQKHKPLLVPIREQHLITGDYTIEGFETRITVERKSLSDLLGTLTAERDRFERELARMQSMDFAAVVVEADWSAILDREHRDGKVNPKAIYRSVIAHQIRFPRTHWWLCRSRTMAEATCFRILERFWNDEQERIGGMT